MKIEVNEGSKTADLGGNGVLFVTLSSFKLVSIFSALFYLVFFFFLFQTFFLHLWPVCGVGRVGKPFKGGNHNKKFPQIGKF